MKIRLIGPRFGNIHTTDLFYVNLDGRATVHSSVQRLILKLPRLD